jgi:sugar lactone lactonase YvrE
MIPRRPAELAFYRSEVSRVAEIGVKRIIPEAKNVRGGQGVGVQGGRQGKSRAKDSMPTGVQTLAFYSVDRSGNTEPLRTVAITVLSTAIPSAVVARLDYPWPGAVGVEQAVGGKVGVLGEVSGPGLRTWNLSVAAGSSTGSGFTTVAVGTAAFSGRMALWDASRLSGWYTLKLTAADGANNASVSSAAVYVGRLEVGFTVGSRGSDARVNELKGPEGILVRPDGKIWTAVDDTDRLLLIGPDGALLTSVGGSGAGSLRFKNPRGMSLDANGNLYVADRGNNRVAKLSADGLQLLKEFKTDISGPNDAVVDADGSVFIADTGHARVRVFKADGAVLRDISTGRNSLPWGLALTKAGLWVSERGERTMRLYAREGMLLKTLPDIGRVRGASADRGQALYVADRTFDRVDKFDPEGRLMLSVGPLSRAKPWERSSLKFLSDPSDAAIGPDGSLWVADSGHDRLVKYVLPTGTAHPDCGHGYGVSAVQNSPVPSLPEETVSRTITSEDGGKIELDDGTAVRIPAGATAAGLTVTVHAAGTAGLSALAVSQKDQRKAAHNLSAVSREIEYGPEGTTFGAPATLILAYDQSRLAGLGVKEDSLRIYYWDTAAGDWKAMETVLNADAGTVSAQTMYFSVYQIMMEGVVPQASADIAFKLGEVYVYPNPAKGKAKPTFHIEVGVADSVKITVYTVSGRVAHEHTITSAPAIVDDGTGAAYAYEYGWDGYIPSGIYYYLMEAEKGGQKLKKTGKFAVIR